MRNVVCPICLSDAEVLYIGNVKPEDYFAGKEDYLIAAGNNSYKLPVYKCKTCGHGFTPIDFDQRVIRDWYKGFSFDAIFVSQKKARSKTARLVLKRIESLIPERGRMIDIGCGPAFFLNEAKRKGWKVTGIEPAGWAVKYSREELNLDGSDLVQGDHSALAQMKRKSFDVVTAFDVIEHAVDADSFIKEASELLRPGGLLVLTTPRFDSLPARVFGKRWYCILPAHLHYFTRSSIRAVLGKYNLSVESEQSHTRYLPVDYLIRRGLAYCGLTGVKVPRLSGALPINLGDEFEIYAKHYCA